MTTSTRDKITIELNPGDKEVLQDKARKLGLVQTRGNTVGQGSLSALMQAIARDEIKIYKEVSK